MKQKLWLMSVILVLLTMFFCLAACVDKETTTYTVTFETNGGAAIDSATVNEGDSLTLSVPEREGYEFDGWYTDAAFSSQPLGATFTPNGNVTLYAKWSETQTEPVVYVVTFVTNGGAAIDTVTVNEGDSVTLSVPVREGYEFDGWYTDAAFSGQPLGATFTPNGNVTLYAKWSETQTEPVVYVVTFVTNGGAAIDSATVNEGDSVTLSVPKREGYEFDGWYTDVAFSGQPLGATFTPNGDVTLYAKWSETQTEPVVYVVTFVTNGGGSVENMTVESGRSIQLPNPPPPPENRLIFAGWFLNEDLSGNAVVSPFAPSGNTTLYAKWEKEKYTISFEVNGGNIIDDIAVEVGASITLPTPQKEGFRFEGWFTQDSLTGTAVTSPYAPDGNVTLYAKWGAPKYVITFDGGAAATIESIEVEVGGSATLPVPTAEGYEFEGWYTDAAFSGQPLGATYTPDGDVTLYAKWTLVATAERYFVFTPDATGKFVSVAASDVTPYPESIVIPDRYNGLPVTVIKENGFASNGNLRNVVIPEGVTEIGRFAFAQCSSLANITIPKSLKYIRGGAFYECGRGRNVYYNGTIADYCGIDYSNLEAQPLYYDGNLYINNTLVTEVVVPESVTEIKAYAFATDYKITKITLPSGLKRIGEKAFYWCLKLEEINIPESLEAIEEEVFEKTKVAVTENGIKYVGNWAIGHDPEAINGVVQFKEGIAGFAYNAMKDCATMTEVTIPNTVKRIGERTFANCLNLIKITIESGIESFGYDAFVNCINLQEFYYTGTLAQWCAINNEEGGDSTPLWYAQIFYVEGEPIVDLVIPETMTTINRGAFQGYLGLKSVVIPKSITVANAQLFNYCENLTDIWCEANSKPADWHKNWRGDVYVTATVHWGGEWEYVNGVPTLKNA